MLILNMGCSYAFSKPPHIVPILVSLSRRTVKPRYLSKQRNSRGQIVITKAKVKSRANGLDAVLEPLRGEDSFYSLLDLVDPLPRRREVSESEHSGEDNARQDATTLPEMAAAEQKPPVPTRPIPPPPTPGVGEPQSSAESPPIEKATTPTDSVPEPGSLAELPPTEKAASTAEADSDPPMASPASIEEFDELEDVDSDLALVGNTPDVKQTPRATPKGITLETGAALMTAVFPRAIEGRSPATPVEELSDMSEIILSPRTRSIVSNTASSKNSSPAGDEPGHQLDALSSPWVPSGPRLYGFQGDYTTPRPPVVHERKISQERDAVAVPSVPARQASPTLTHSQAEDIQEEQETPYMKPSPPPRPVRSPDRPSPSSSRNNSVSSVPSLPLPPPMAILRQTHRNPIPIPTSTFSAEKSTQPRLNPSPKILAMIQKFEGTSRESDDLGNVFVGSTRSLSVSPSRRGSESSSKMEPNYGSLWTSYNTPPSSRPDTPNSVSEFGEQMYPNSVPTNMEVAREMEVRWRGDGRTSDMVNQANWDLRPTTTTRRGSLPVTSRLVGSLC